MKQSEKHEATRPAHILIVDDEQAIRKVWGHFRKGGLRG